MTTIQLRGCDCISALNGLPDLYCLPEDPSAFSRMVCSKGWTSLPILIPKHIDPALTSVLTPYTLPDRQIICFGGRPVGKTEIPPDLMCLISRARSFSLNDRVDRADKPLCPPCEPIPLNPHVFRNHSDKSGQKRFGGNFGFCPPPGLDIYKFSAPPSLLKSWI